MSRCGRGGRDGGGGGGTRPRLGIAAVLLAVACRSAVAQTPQMLVSPQGTLDPDQLQVGETGYGLSVFAGVVPARFDIKVIGVLRNALAGQDIILIRCSGQGLEQSRIVAGMSGSPVYVRDRLIGALAYGWMFSTEPIAGVTPIRSMLRELGEPGRSGRAPSTTPPGLSPIASPLSTWGIGRRVLDRHGALLAALGLEAGLGGGGGNASGDRGGNTTGGVGGSESGRAGKGAPPAAPTGAPSGSSPAQAASKGPDLAPGGALAVHLIRGDLGMAATGTVTWRQGNRMLAFGHPFLGGGPLTLPAGPALVHCVLPSVQRSFKISTPFDPTAHLTWDGQAGIVLEAGGSPAMIPISIKIVDATHPGTRSLRIEVASVPRLTPELVQVAVEAALEAAGGSSDDVTVGYALTARYEGGETVSLADLAYTGRGALFPPEPLARLLVPLDNPLARTTLASLDVSLDIQRSRQTASIERAYFTQRELVPGADASLIVVLKPFGKDAQTRRISLHVPEAAAGSHLEIEVSGGAQAPPDVAPPERIEDLFAAVRAHQHATDLVCRLSLPGQRLLLDGHVLDRLPRSVMPILSPPNGSSAKTLPEVQRCVEPTPWVLEGNAHVSVPVKEDRIE